jgi:hypothetical protein
MRTITQKLSVYDDRNDAPQMLGVQHEPQNDGAVGGQRKQAKRLDYYSGAVILPVVYSSQSSFIIIITFN